MFDAIFRKVDSETLAGHLPSVVALNPTTTYFVTSHEKLPEHILGMLQEVASDPRAIDYPLGLYGGCPKLALHSIEAYGLTRSSNLCLGQPGYSGDARCSTCR